MHTVIIQKSHKPDKKFKAIIDNKKTVHFGAKGMSNFTKHKDEARKQRYINRHKKNENWNASGFDTAGFYAKHILWNKPTIEQSINDVNNTFKSLNVKMK